MTKPIVIIVIILIAIGVYLFLDQYSNSGDFPNLQASLSEEPSSEEPSLKEPSSPKKFSENFLPNSKLDVKTEVSQSEPTVSPYYGKVKLARPRTASYYSPAVINLSIRPNYGEEINITGWKIKTRLGEFIIPQGIERYQSHISPRDIIIKENMVIYLISTKNPLGRDKNFRPNNCFGYLQNYHTFYPYLYTSCPRPTLEDVAHLNPFCQEFILRLSPDEIPDYSNKLRISGDSQCTTYLKENFSYTKAFNKYSQDKNFLLNYWYIYTNTNIVEKLHDTIYLYDQNNLLIDKYVY